MTSDKKLQSLENRLAALELRRKKPRLLWISIAMALPLGLWAATTIPNTFSDGETLSAAKLNANFAALAANDGAPVGTIVAFAGSTAPTGWLLCDGTQVSRSTYAALYAVTANAYGSGDGSTSFHLPDLRGRFLRGVDGSAGVDPDKASRTAMNGGGNAGNFVGSVQGDDLRSHNHNFTGNAITRGLGANGSNQVALGDNSTISSITPSGTISNTGGNETRPVNAYVNFIIKY